MSSSDFEAEEVIKAWGKQPLSNAFVLFPAIEKLVGGMSGLNILDLGGGDGKLARLLAEKGASVTTVDKSQKLIDVCNKENSSSSTHCVLGDASNLTQFTGSSFDVVVMNMVFITMQNQEEIKTTVSEVARILKKEGKLIFSDIHPATLAGTGIVEQHIPRDKNFSYFQNGAQLTSKIKLYDGSILELPNDRHWTLELYTKALSEVGLYISNIIEPQPIEDAPRDFFENYQFPEFIIIEALKF